jgi:integrase
VRKKVGTIRTLFNAAADKQLLRFGNPCHRVRIKVPKNRKKPRLPFSIDELDALFRSPIFVTGWRPRGRGGDAYFWMPLLACFSGAREEELGQLRVGDIVRVHRLGWMMRITDEAPDVTVKTGSSRRNVPLHAQVMRCGFLGYVERQRAAGHEWLFHELTPSTYGKRTTSFSKVFKRYLKSAVSIDKKTHVFHSFRHGFKDACRDSGIDMEVHDALTGHKTPGVGGVYRGESYPLRPLFDAIKRLQYRGLDLSHLHQQ